MFYNLFNTYDNVEITDQCDTNFPNPTLTSAFSYTIFSVFLM